MMQDMLAHERRPGLRTESAAKRRGAAKASERRLRLELDAATSKSALAMSYQPRVHLRSGAVTGAEALLRWQHRRGLVTQASFIPLAEELGHIRQIGGWALLQACVEGQDWLRGVVSVNVSGRQLRDGVLLEQVARALETSGLLPERLELELAEDALADGSVDALLALSAIRDLGVGLALDRFGAGLTSLATLRRLPLTMMKLDHALVRDLPRDLEGAAIVRALIGAGRALGLSIVADGIETEDQRAFLSDCGCDEGQGCLFGKAMPGLDMRAKLGGARVA